MRRLLDFWPLGVVPLLVAVVLVMRFANIVDLKITKAQADLSTLESALSIYKSKHGDFPSKPEGLVGLTGNGEPLLYLPKDPWGNSYLYDHVAGTDSYVLYSAGVDHRDEGGQGDDVILGPKHYRCADYGVNCPPTAGQVGAWIALVLALFSLIVGLVRGTFVLSRTVSRFRS
jgi:general secretion pathway protein G